MAVLLTCMFWLRSAEWARDSAFPANLQEAWTPKGQGPCFAQDELIPSAGRGSWSSLRETSSQSWGPWDWALLDPLKVASRCHPMGSVCRPHCVSKAPPWGEDAKERQDSRVPPSRVSGPGLPTCSCSPFASFWFLLSEPDSYSKTFLLSHTQPTLHDRAGGLAACREGADICLNWSYLCKSRPAPPHALSL